MRILLVCNPGRKDLLSYFQNDASNNYYLLYNDKKQEKLDEAFNFIREESGWNEFNTPYQVLRKIKPDRIIFHEVFDLKQIALCIAAKNKKIPCFFLDHGIWSEFEELLEEDVKVQNQTRKDKLRKLKRTGKVIKGYFFYYSTIMGISFLDLAKFLAFPVYAFTSSLMKAINSLPFKGRIPDTFILFTRYNLRPLQSFYHFTDEQVIYSGFPYFDDFFTYINQPQSDYIVFIDHPYLEDGILGWDRAFHKKLAVGLLHLACKAGVQVKVKLHPRSDINVWRQYNFPLSKIDFIQIIHDNTFYMKAKIIIGYASTLMIGFISAKKNVVLVGWHPNPTIFGPDYSEWRVCHKSMSIEDIDVMYDEWTNNNLSKANNDAYDAFLKEFNFPFDGKATKRITNIITAE